MPKAAPAAFSLLQALLTSFDTNDRINQYMIENLPTHAWPAAPPTARDELSPQSWLTMRNVRVMWLKAAANDCKIPKQLNRTSVTPAHATKALEQSRTALRSVLKSALQSDGRVKGFRPYLAGVFGYLIARDAHHGDQISMLTRQVGVLSRRRPGSACGSGAQRVTRAPSPVGEGT